MTSNDKLRDLMSTLCNSIDVLDDFRKNEVPAQQKANLYYMSHIERIVLQVERIAQKAHERIDELERKLKDP